LQRRAEPRAADFPSLEKATNCGSAQPSTRQPVNKKESPTSSECAKGRVGGGRYGLRDGGRHSAVLVARYRKEGPPARSTTRSAVRQLEARCCNIARAGRKARGCAWSFRAQPREKLDRGVRGPDHGGRLEGPAGDILPSPTAEKAPEKRPQIRREGGLEPVAEACWPDRAAAGRGRGLLWTLDMGVAGRWRRAALTGRAIIASCSLRDADLDFGEICGGTDVGRAAGLSFRVRDGPAGVGAKLAGY